MQYLMLGLLFWLIVLPVWFSLKVVFWDYGTIGWPDGMTRRQFLAYRWARAYKMFTAICSHRKRTIELMVTFAGSIAAISLSTTPSESLLVRILGMVIVAPLGLRLCWLLIEAVSEGDGTLEESTPALRRYLTTAGFIVATAGALVCIT